MNLYKLYDIEDDGNFYVYELHNPINNQPFYVGKGKNNRFTNHFTRKNKNSHKNNTISKIISLDRKVIVKIVYRTNNEFDAFKKESELIYLYGRRDNSTGILTNLTNGGEGLSGYIPTPELRELWSVIRSGEKNGMYNKAHTIESKNKMTETRLKRYKSGVIKPTIHTEEYKKKLAERTTKKVDEESIFRLNGIGYSVNEIVRETGINRDIVIRRLKKYNLPSNSKKEKIVDMFKIHKMLENNIDKILICEEFNISLSTLNRKLKKNKK
jgi:hypothetical protein